MGVWQAPVTYGTDKRSDSVVNCHVDTSEAGWCKVNTNGISKNSIFVGFFFNLPIIAFKG